MSALTPSDIKLKKTPLGNGVLKVEYNFKGNTCAIYEIKNKEAITCNINEIFIKDFKNLGTTLAITKEYYEKLRHELNTFTEDCTPDHTILRSLVNSSIVTYSKITTSSRLYGRSNIFLDHIKQHLTQKEIILHTEIKTMRDKWIAHTDANLYESARTALIIDQSQTKSPMIQTHVSFKHISVNDEFMLGFQALVERILAILHSKQMKDIDTLCGMNFLIEPGDITTSMKFHDI
jgi:hypothetical protein